MRKILVSLVAVAMFVFAASAKADYVVSKSVTVAFDSTGRTAQVLLDLSEWQGSLGTQTSLLADISLETTVTSEFGITRRNTATETPDLGGTYQSRLESLFDVTNTSNGIVASGSQIIYESYTIASGTFLTSSGDETSLVSKQTGINNSWNIDILPYLNSSNELLFNFYVFTDGATVNANIPSGYRGGIDIYDYDVATINISFTLPGDNPATPEPATLLIFGIAAVAGFPLVRRMRRK